LPISILGSPPFSTPPELPLRHSIRRMIARARKVIRRELDPGGTGEIQRCRVCQEWFKCEPKLEPVEWARACQDCRGSGRTPEDAERERRPVARLERSPVAKKKSKKGGGKGC